MNYLLDTHTFLWFINNDPALSSTARETIENPVHTIYLSIASIWEMAIKVSLGKLSMPTPFIDFITNQLKSNTMTILAIKTEHISNIIALPFHHRDPFDRLIIAQAQHEGFTIIGNDSAFDAYGVQRIW